MSQVALVQGQTTASVFGTVSDATGAVLPGATVTVTNVDTGVTRTVLTDDEGRYQAVNLALGSYEVSGELVGFQVAVRSGITLTMGREAEVDLTLSVGEITERVTVTGEAPPGGDHQVGSVRSAGYAANRGSSAGWTQLHPAGGHAGGSHVAQQQNRC